MSAGIREVLNSLLAELRDEACPNTQALCHCERAAATLVHAAHALLDDLSSQEREDICASLLHLVKRAHAEMAAGGTRTRGWRRVYTDASILLAFADIFKFQSSYEIASAFSAISHLDHAIVIAGAPGEGRMDLILDLIRTVQSKYLASAATSHHVVSSVGAKRSPSRLPIAPLFTATRPVPCLDIPPSLNSFISRLSRQPFVLRKYLLDWPALNDHPWSSLDYMRAVAGPGRVIPVEVGSDYRSDDWTQTIMPWEDFLSSLEEPRTGVTPKPVLYLAQHSLFNQFPTLKDDILVPDYVYSDFDSPGNFPQYVPPANEERLVLNAWLGPRGTVSPAHTDPFFNFYAQVVGRKTVWLASPEVSLYMYPYPHASSSSPLDQPRHPAANTESPSMSNTTRVDVFLTSPEGVAASESEYPDLWDHVVPEAMSVTLEPGDLLYFPPGWWHAMRSEETSFSVSMWF